MNNNPLFPSQELNTKKNYEVWVVLPSSKVLIKKVHAVSPLTPSNLTITTPCQIMLLNQIASQCGILVEGEALHLIGQIDNTELYMLYINLTVQEKEFVAETFDGEWVEMANIEDSVGQAELSTALLQSIKLLNLHTLESVQA